MGYETISSDIFILNFTMILPFIAEFLFSKPEPGTLLAIRIGLLKMIPTELCVCVCVCVCSRNVHMRTLVIHTHCLTKTAPSEQTHHVKHRNFLLPSLSFCFLSQTHSLSLLHLSLSLTSLSFSYIHSLSLSLTSLSFFFSLSFFLSHTLLCFFHLPSLCVSLTLIQYISRNTHFSP